MIWALLAILGVPIWLVSGMLGVALWNRHQFKQKPGVFRLKFRQDLSAKWSFQSNYGRWVHDVLIINKGLGLVQTTTFGVQSLIMTEISEPVKGIDNAIVFNLKLDDETDMQIAVTNGINELAQGPFVER